MYIASEPMGKVYRDLIGLAFHVCDEFILVIRNDLTVSKNAKTLLDRLAPFINEKREQLEWPGTRLGERCKPVTVYYYMTDKEALKILLEVSESLISWQQPRLPEDLCFLKNRKPWLINSAHEHESYFGIVANEEIEKIMNIADLEVNTIGGSKNTITEFPNVFNYKCLFCNDNLHEGDIAPEKGFICLDCLDNDLDICELDNKIFNKQLVNKSNLIIDDIQILRIENFELLEKITNKFINHENASACSNKCFNLLYINECIERLQNIETFGEESSAFVNTIIDNNGDFNSVLKSKIDELKSYKYKYQLK